MQANRNRNNRNNQRMLENQLMAALNVPLPNNNQRILENQLRNARNIPLPNNNAPQRNVLRRIGQRIRNVFIQNQPRQQIPIPPRRNAVRMQRPSANRQVQNTRYFILKLPISNRGSFVDDTLIDILFYVLSLKSFVQKTKIVFLENPRYAGAYPTNIGGVTKQLYTTITDILRKKNQLVRKNDAEFFSFAGASKRASFVCGYLFAKTIAVDKHKFNVYIHPGIFKEEMFYMTSDINDVMQYVHAVNPKLATKMLETLYNNNVQEIPEFKNGYINFLVNSLLNRNATKEAKLAALAAKEMTKASSYFMDGFRKFYNDYQGDKQVLDMYLNEDTTFNQLKNMITKVGKYHNTDLKLSKLLRKVRYTMRRGNQSVSNRDKVVISGALELLANDGKLREFLRFATACNELNSSFITFTVHKGNSLQLPVAHTCGKSVDISMKNTTTSQQLYEKMKYALEYSNMFGLV